VLLSISKSGSRITKKKVILSINGHRELSPDLSLPFLLDIKEEGVCPINHDHLEDLR
jgi:hypothetical protein